jgi:glycosyltransferase involved in cell wall biosynthesis
MTGLRPPISVVIPVYDGARYLGEAIASVLAQGHEPLEIVLVDDGSTDGSVAAAGPFAAAVRVLRQSNQGAPAARNHGARAARGDLLAFLDSDDLWVAGRLDRQLACFAADPRLEMVWGMVEQFLSPDLGEATRARRAYSPEPLPGPGPHTMLIKRDAFWSVGPFDTSLRIGESIAWLARAREAGIRELQLAAVLLRRRLHGTNMTVQRRDARTDYLRIAREALERRRSHEPNRDD